MILIKKTLDEISNNFLTLGDESVSQIEEASKLIIKSLQGGGKIMFCGNGGSAAESQHLSTELLGKYLKIRKALASVDLTSNTSLITSIGNDISFKEIFARQISAIGLKNDVLFAITTSGKSKNIINAIKIAKKKGLKIILLSSDKAQKLSRSVDLFIPSPGSRVDRIQETHTMIGHLIYELVEEKFA